MNAPTYLLATRSSGKLRELREMASAFGVDVIDLDEAGVVTDLAEDDIEVFQTFEENARAKAAYFFQKSGLPTLADDSGLVVHVLGGEPGVHSKRWSGRTDLNGSALDNANNKKLVAALEQLPADTIASSEYVCVTAFNDGTHDFVVRGTTAGQMTTHPRGDKGFGYDPYFVSDELQKTFGEASSQEKHEISHRGRAFRQLFSQLVAIGAVPAF